MHPFCPGPLWQPLPWLLKNKNKKNFLDWDNCAMEHGKDINAAQVCSGLEDRIGVKGIPNPLPPYPLPNSCWHRLHQPTSWLGHPQTNLFRDAMCHVCKFIIHLNGARLRLEDWRGIICSGAPQKSSNRYANDQVRRKAAHLLRESNQVGVMNWNAQGMASVVACCRLWQCWRKGKWYTLAWWKNKAHLWKSNLEFEMWSRVQMWAKKVAAVMPVPNWGQVSHWKERLAIVNGTGILQFCCSLMGPCAVPAAAAATISISKHIIRFATIRYAK